MKRILIAASLALLPALAHAAPYLPTYGSPNSAQFQTLRVGLNLEDISDESNDRFGVPGDSDTIGVAGTRWGASGTDGDRIDGHYQKAWRPFEGSRARLLLDVPVSALNVDHESGTAYLASVNLGLEMPVTNNWALTPRAAYGYVSANDGFGGNGELASVSLSSRYRIAQLGRGDLVIGDLIGYTTTVKTGINSQPFYGRTSNGTFRNGLAYQYPLESRIFGRQASLRVSYVNTQLTGDVVPYQRYNELAASFGVRTRESIAKNTFEMLRFGVLYTWADDYDAATVTVGYRF